MADRIGRIKIWRYSRFISEHAFDKLRLIDCTFDTAGGVVVSEDAGPVLDARAVGLGGRARRMGSQSERARVRVRRAVRRALERIGEHHAPLAAHLEHALQTGTYCAYKPDPRTPVTWTVTAGR